MRVLEIGKATFWCGRCDHEVELPAEKFERVPGDVVWRARCPGCTEMLVRFIQNVKDDPYFHENPRIQKERKRFSPDFKQDSRFTFPTGRI